VWREPVGCVLFEVAGFWVGAPFIGEDTHQVSRVVVVEDTHEFAEVDVRDAGVAADDKHVLVIGAL
jgi:hypothetical protein